MLRFQPSPLLCWLGEASLFAQGHHRIDSGRPARGRVKDEQRGEPAKRQQGEQFPSQTFARKVAAKQKRPPAIAPGAFCSEIG